MPSYLANRLQRISAWVAIGLAGAVVGWWNSRALEIARRADLTERASLAAVAFDEGNLRQLPGARTDVGTPGYTALKARLRQVKAADPVVRFVYIFRCLPETGKVIFLGDSADPGASDESLPGSEYPQAPGSPGLQQIMRTGMPASEGPLGDDFGSWITAYAAVGTWNVATDPKTPRHVIGLDVSAADWQRQLVVAGAERAVMVWIFLGIPLGTWLMFRRQREQNEVIRNLSGAMEQAHSAILITDLSGRIEYGNRGLSRQLGYSRRELIGRNWRDFQAGNAAGAVVGEIVGSLQAGVAWEGRWETRRKDGTVFPARGGFTPVKHRDGTIA